MADGLVEFHVLVPVISCVTPVTGGEQLATAGEQMAPLSGK